MPKTQFCSFHSVSSSRPPPSTGTVNRSFVGKSETGCYLLSSFSSGWQYLLLWCTTKKCNEAKNWNCSWQEEKGKQNKREVMMNAHSHCYIHTSFHSLTHICSWTPKDVHVGLLLNATLFYWLIRIRAPQLKTKGNQLKDLFVSRGIYWELGAPWTTSGSANEMAI